MSGVEIISENDDTRALGIKDMYHCSVHIVLSCLGSFSANMRHLQIFSVLFVLVEKFGSQTSFIIIYPKSLNELSECKPTSFFM